MEPCKAKLVMLRAGTLASVDLFPRDERPSPWRHSSAGFRADSGHGGQQLGRKSVIWAGSKATPLHSGFVS